MENTVKGIFAAISAFFLSLFGALSPWVMVILAVMILDYGTGMAAAWLNEELNSKKGIRGIVKKLSYMVIIAAAMIADWAVMEGTSFLGFELPAKGFFALLVIIWLLINELISILENVGRMGTEYPEWFMKLLARLKQTVDQKGDKLNG